MTYNCWNCNLSPDCPVLAALSLEDWSLSHNVCSRHPDIDIEGDMGHLSSLEGEIEALEASLRERDEAIEKLREMGEKHNS